MRIRLLIAGGILTSLSACQWIGLVGDWIAGETPPDEIYRIQLPTDQTIYSSNAAQTHMVNLLTTQYIMPTGVQQLAYSSNQYLDLQFAALLQRENIVNINPDVQKYKRIRHQIVQDPTSDTVRLWQLFIIPSNVDTPEWSSPAIRVAK